MEENTIRQIKGSEFWESHVLKAQEFEGSEQDYCRLHKLSRSTFSGYKKKMGLVKPEKVKRRAFVKLITKDVPQSKSKETWNCRLPDAGWVAELILALTGRQ